VKGRLGKYSLWQLRDFFMQHGIGIAIIGLLWGYTLLAPLRAAMSTQSPTVLTPGSPIWGIVVQITSAVVSVSVLIAMNGIVSSDRKNGYYRFLLSKPINRVVYYAQAFLVYMAGVLLIMAVLSALLRTILPSFNVYHFVLYTALVYVAMGGIGFFLSVATRYDWLSLAAVWLGSRMLRGIYSGPRAGWKGKAVEILPPVHRLDDVANSLIGTGSAPSSDVVWLVGYGLLCFALGLVVLRYGSMAD
jgi:ABC-type transport system involved in multi-copper enzyme maturation permease subunit